MGDFAGRAAFFLGYQFHAAVRARRVREASCVEPLCREVEVPATSSAYFTPLGAGCQADLAHFEHAAVVLGLGWVVPSTIAAIA